MSDRTSTSGRTVGYVGLDHHHAEPYLETLETLPATVTGAVESSPAFDPGSMSSLGDVPVYDSLEKLLDAERPDAVFLTLPNRDTPRAIEQAVDAGVDVYTEKPAARIASELRPLVERVAASDATVCVSYPWQFHPITAELQRLVDEGFFGDVRAFDARFMASQLVHRDTSNFLFDADASRGGILQWLGIHWLQLFEVLLPGRLERVNANMTSQTDGVEVEDVATLQLEMDDGGLGSLQCGYVLGEGRYDTEFDIYGSAGRSSWDPIGREFGFDGETSLELGETGSDRSSTPRREITHEYDSAPGYGGAWGREFVEAFFEACDDGTEPPVTLEDAHRVLQVLDAAYESAETDGWVRVDDAGP